MLNLKRMFLFLLIAFLGTPVWAQTDAKPYMVIGNKPVNARSCPQVKCPVVMSIQPGETVMVVDTVTGDVTLGSNQWYKVEMDGKTAYVHSALVKETALESTGESATSSKVDTSNWAEYKGKDFSILFPQTWSDTFKLYENKKYLESVAELHGMTPAELKAQIDAMKANGMVAMFYDPNTVTNIELEKIDTSDWANPPSLKQLRPAYKASMIERGSELISDELLNLPAGDCLHIHAKQAAKNGEWKVGTQLVHYFVINGNYLYVLSFYTSSKSFDQKDAIFEAVAQSLMFSRGTANT